jgi:hypothetical protein
MPIRLSGGVVRGGVVPGDASPHRHAAVRAGADEDVGVPGEGRRVALGGAEVAYEVRCLNVGWCFLGWAWVFGLRR